MNVTVAFLTADTGRLLRKRFDAMSRAHGATGPQWRALAALNRTPGMTQAALAGWLEVEPITAGRMIDRLEKAGLVERRADPADRRAWRLYLAEGAAPILAELQKLADQLHADALAGLDQAERDQLLNLLTRVRANLLDDAPYDIAAAPAAGEQSDG